jgi:hypothetical protein
MARQETGEKSISNIFIKTATTNLDRDSIAIENDKLILTKISRRVLEHKNKITACIIKQNKGIIFIFSRGDLV